MKLINILSSDLPEIDDSIKECINFGQWLLFKTSTQITDDVNVSFYLKIDSSIYALTARGRILEKVNVPKPTFNIEELVYFSDLPKPQSLSNAQLARL